MKWIIHYAKGRTFTDQDGSAFDAPPRGVLLIAMEDPDHGRFHQCGTDYYVWDDRGDGDRWWGVDHFGLYDYLEEPGPKKVIFGRTLTNREFNRVYREAEAHGYIPAHTAFASRERKP